MKVPDWWQTILLALAAWRTWKLLAGDMILDRPRRYVTGGWGDFLGCPYCSGFWIALGWFGAWEQWSHGALVAATPLVLSAIVALITEATPE